MTPLHVAARWSFVIVVAFVLQIALVTQVNVFGVMPDIMVVLAVCAGLSGGAQRGAVVGFWLGLAFDMPRTEHPLGLSALAYCLVAFVAGTAQVVVLQSGRLMSMAIVAAASFVGVLLFAVEGQFFGGDTIGERPPGHDPRGCGARRGPAVENRAPSGRLGRWSGDREARRSD